ncbi:MAG: NAD(P) transhydrogenase subunit alpha [Planctomycetaceae bacterium]|nr:NAD(P) transhydrogenase subunit alpha [Planctomycetaceae bacterium]
MTFNIPFLFAGIPDASQVNVASVAETVQSAAEQTGVSVAPDNFLTLVFVFMLATFTGLLVIRNVSRLLHTPLMSLTNAISAIAVVGSIVIAGNQASNFTTILGTVAVVASMTNIVSGFMLTDRMLKMFKKREPGK